MKTLVGQEFDNYRIIEFIGRGGMGVVFKAVQISLKRTVAVKMINPMLSEDETFLRKFRKEAQTLARLRHKHIVGVIDFRTTKYGKIIVMEFIEGGTLADQITNDGALSEKKALQITRQILKGTGYAHRKGLIHRDIKPRNIMITTEDVVKLTDFGLAKYEHSSADSTLAEETTTTGRGGTFHYMSPEQIETPDLVDKRTDVFSIGITLFELLAGRRPFEDSSSNFQIQKKITEGNFPRPDTFNPQITPELSQIIMTSIHRDREQRYQTAEEMLEAITSYEENRLVDEVVSNKPAPTKTEKTTGMPLSEQSSHRGFLQKIGEEVHSAIASSQKVLENFDWQAVTQRYRVLILAIGAVLILALAVKFFDKNDQDRQPPVINEIKELPQPPSGYLAVSILPANAIVILDDSLEINGQAKSDIQLSAGMHRLTASANGFNLFDTTFRVVAGARDSIHLTMTQLTEQALTGMLVVTSSPRKASIYINGRRHGTTPRSISDYPVGNYRVRISKQGFRDFYQDIIVREGQSINLNAILETQEKFGSLKVSSIPPGAEVTIGGNKMGLTPLTIDKMPVGDQEVELALERHADAVRSVQVEEGQISKLMVSLNQQIVKLTIEVNPVGSLFIDGQPIPGKDLRTYEIDIEAGKHVVLFESARGKWKKEENITLDRHIIIDLDRTLNIIVVPEGAPNAMVYIDGKEMGWGRNPYKINVGLHEIAIKRDGYRSIAGKLLKNFEQHMDGIKIPVQMEKIEEN